METLAIRAPRSSLNPAVWAVAAFLLVTVSRMHEMIPPIAEAPVGKVTLGIAILFLIFAQRERLSPILAERISKLWIAFFIIAALTVPISVWGSYSVEVLTGPLLIAIIAYFLVVRTADNMKTWRFLFEALGLSALVIGFNGILSYSGTRLRFGGTYDPNDLSMFLVTLLPLVLVSAHLRKGIGKKIRLVGAVLIAATVIFTQSRGGFLGLVLILFYLVASGLWGGGKKTKLAGRMFKASIAVGLILMLSWSFIPEAAQNRIGTILNLSQDYNLTDDGGRLGIWKRHLGNVARRPWGYGVGNAGAADFQGGGVYQAPHNTFIEVAVEMGLAGLIVYIMVYRAAFAGLRKYWQQGGLNQRPGQDGNEAYETMVYAIALRGSLIGFLVTSFLLSHAYSSIFYVLTALCVAFWRIQEHKSRALDGTRSAR